MVGPDEPETPSCPAPSGSELSERWDDLHPEDQEFAAMVLDAMGDVASFDEWEQFVDLALDLRPAVERGVLTIEQVRRVALALLEHAKSTEADSG